MARSAVHAAIVKLSPWSHHHGTCARVTDAADCDCGLQATLLEIDAAPVNVTKTSAGVGEPGVSSPSPPAGVVPSQSGDSGQTDVPLPFGEEFA